jgi:hypothetical protein
VGGNSGRDERKGGEDDGREGRAGQVTARETERVLQIFTRRSLLCCLKRMDAPCYPDIIRFVYEEFQVDAVKTVEKRVM